MAYVLIRHLVSWKTYHVYVPGKAACCCAETQLCMICSTCGNASYHREGITPLEYREIIHEIEVRMKRVPPEVLKLQEEM